MNISMTMNKVSKVLVIIASVTIVLMLAVTFIDVTTSKLFNRPIPGASELIGAVMPISVFGFLLEVHLRGKHILVDILTSKVSYKFQLIFRMIAWAIGLFICSTIAWNYGPVVWESIQIRDVTAGIIPFPLYPARMMILLATALMSIQLINDILTDGISLIRD